MFVLRLFRMAVDQRQCSKLKEISVNVIDLESGIGQPF